MKNPWKPITSDEQFPTDDADMVSRAGMDMGGVATVTWKLEDDATRSVTVFRHKRCEYAISTSKEGDVSIAWRRRQVSEGSAEEF